jgi:hypothetical protein
LRAAFVLEDHHVVEVPIADSDGARDYSPVTVTKVLNRADFSGGIMIWVTPP